MYVPTRPPWRILVADDEEEVRQVCREVLENLGCEVLLVANGRDALYRLQRERVDLVILDLAMPIMDGTQVLEHLRLFLPDVPVIILTAHASIESCVEHLKKGADMYLPKPFDVEELEALVLALLESPRKGAEPFWERARKPVRLSERERVVLRLMREGLSDQEMAQRLGLSVKTVQNHVASILDKMGARNRTEAVAMSYRKSFL